MKIDFNTYLNTTGEVGVVKRVVSSLVYIQGLPGVQPEELVVFESGEVGQVNALLKSTVELLNFSHTQIKVGSRVARTGMSLEIPVGEALLGSIVNCLGHSLNPLKPLPSFKETRPIYVNPIGIHARARIKRACHTGVSLVDLMLPLGKGQRELVIGDQKTGKTRFLLRALLSQVKEGSVGIYVAIGKSQLAIKQVDSTLVQMGIRDSTIIVATSAHDGVGMIYLAPYAAMTIAEYFRDSGRDVILVLDDLLMHAKAYREISLLGRKFPGRNSYPGDIFYIHARLLERAGNFIHGGAVGKEVSITCLPVVEAAQGDLAGYIQTNTMAMTDGHLFFDHNLFAAGRRPAIDPFISVTRVGRQTQTRLQQEIGRVLITFFRSVEKVHSFKSFGAEVGEHIKQALAKEERMIEFFDQTAYDTIPLNVQLVLFAFVWSELWSEKIKSDIRFLIQKTIFLAETKPGIKRRIDDFISGCDSLEMLLKRIKDFEPFNEGEK